MRELHRISSHLPRTRTVCSPFGLAHSQDITNPKASEPRFNCIPEIQVEKFPLSRPLSRPDLWHSPLSIPAALGQLLHSPHPQSQQLAHAQNPDAAVMHFNAVVALGRCEHKDRKSKTVFPTVHRSEMQGEFLISTVQFCQYFADLHLRFPGEIRNPPHIPQGMKQSSFIARFRELGGPKITKHGLKMTEFKKKKNMTNSRDMCAKLVQTLRQCDVGHQVDAVVQVKRLVCPSDLIHLLWPHVNGTIWCLGALPLF